jgi:putative phosphoribosyl transferase
MVFADRRDAGRRLAVHLAHLAGRDVVVLALPRGGVPVGFEVAAAIGAPLDVIVVRKLGVPSQPELGMGAIGEDGVVVMNPEVVRAARVTSSQIEAIAERERHELDRRAQRFRGDRTRVAIGGRTVVIVDDGIATGSTARAACQVARAAGADRVILAVPVGPPTAVADLRGDADEVVVADTPSRLYAIGEWYRDFSQTSDEEVVDLLAAARGPGYTA